MEDLVDKFVEFNLKKNEPPIKRLSPVFGFGFSVYNDTGSKVELDVIQRLSKELRIKNIPINNYDLINNETEKICINVPLSSNKNKLRTTNLQFVRKKSHNPIKIGDKHIRRVTMLKYDSISGKRHIIFNLTDLINRDKTYLLRSSAYDKVDKIIIQYDIKIIARYITKQLKKNPHYLDDKNVYNIDDVTKLIKALFF